MLFPLISRVFKLFQPSNRARLNRKSIAPRMAADVERLESRQLLSGAGLVITPTFDSSINLDPNATAIKATINNVITEYQAAFSDPITLNIKFQEISTTVSKSIWTTTAVPYSTFRTDLVANSSTVNDAAVLSHLPNTTVEPVLGLQNVLVKTANYQALNPTLVPPTTSGTILINPLACYTDRSNPDPTKFDLAAVVARELNNVMGLGSALDPSQHLPNILPMDLFRYDANQSRTYTTNTAVPAYFSLDSSTRLEQFNSSGPSGLTDNGDWNADGTGPVYHVQDAVLPKGVNIDPNVEFVALDAIGYHYAGPSDITLSNSTILEHSPPLSFVSTLNTVEVVSGNPFKYQLVAGPGGTDNASFMIDSNGNLRTTRIFDYATKSSYSILVQSTGPNGLTLQKAFTINVLPVTHSRTLVVDVSGDTNQADHTTLRNAIQIADLDPAGDVITFAPSLSGKTIILTQGELNVTNSMTINGLGPNQLTVSGSTTNAASIFDISSSSANVSITGLKLTKGSASTGGAIYNVGNLTISNDIITGNVATGGTTNQGGGIFNSGSIVSSYNTISGNVITGGTSTENDGGGIFNSGSFTTGNDNISGNSISGGISSLNRGGGIANLGTFTMTDDTISGNSIAGGVNSENDGGGIANSQSLITTNVTITGNSMAGGNGSTTNAGGVFNSSGIWNSLNTIVALNSSGGDVANQSGTLAVQNSLIGDTSSGLTNGTNGNIINPTNQTIFASSGLGFNGGPTQTIPLAPNSPAIGTATSLGVVTADNGIKGLVVSNINFIAVNDALKIGNVIVRVTQVTAGPGTTGTVLVQRPQAGTGQTLLTGFPISLAADQTGAVSASPDLGARSSNHSLVVTSPADDLVPPSFDHMTLRDALAVVNANADVLAPNNGYAITFASNLIGGTITLTMGTLNIASSVTITGLGSNQLAVSANSLSNIFNISPSSINVNISGLELNKGMATLGGAILNHANLTLSNDLVDANIASGSSISGGGGIWSDGSLTLSNDTISGNSATGGLSADGGGIWNGGKLTISNTVISNNSVSNGISENHGGGIYSISGSLNTSGTTISTNSASGIFNEGGGVFLANSQWTSSLDTISGNTATNGDTNIGGGVFNYLNGSVTLSQDTISGNNAAGTGGGVQNQGALTANTVTISGNSAVNGSGLFNFATGKVSLTNDTIANNSAVSTGGGIENHGSLITRHVTISGNSASVGNGGGLLLIGGNWNSIDAIVALNTGGDIFNQNANVKAFNTLVGDTSASSGLINGVNGNIVNPANQVIFSSTGLVNAGGPTPTLPLAVGSPAIGSGGALGIVTADNNTSLSVDNINFIAVGDLLKIGKEFVQVSAITPQSGNAGTLTVVRGQDASIQAPLANLPITLAIDQTQLLSISDDIGARSAQHLFTVTSALDDSAPVTADHTTLRAAVNQANLVGNFDALGDLISFLSSLSGQTITLTQGVINISGSMTIPGFGPKLLTVSGNKASGIFNINSTSAIVSITGMTLTNGNSTQGGAINSVGSLTLDNDVITGNTVSGQISSNGGGVASTGNLTIKNSSITGNQAIGNTFNNGGGVYESGGPLSISNSIISNNMASGNSTNTGGGIYAFGGALLIANSTISGNSAIGNAIDLGGGLSANVFGFQISNSTFTGNQATGGGNCHGGAIEMLGGAGYQIINSTISNNLASGSALNSGGGIDVAGELTILNSTISGNGAIATASGINSGGGINAVGPLTLANDTVAFNSATGAGGSVDQVYGGGINFNGILTTTDSTLVGNSVTKGGAFIQGGGINPFGTWNSANTIVANSVGGDVYYNSQTKNAVFNAKNTLISDTSSGLTNNVNGNIINPTNQNIFATSNGKPVLANNGGPTQTVGLALGSPALGTGGILGTVTADNTGTLNVSDTTFITVGESLKIGSEIVQVTGVGTGTITVLRGQGGTNPVNLASQPITLAYDQRAIKRTQNDIGAVAAVAAAITSANNATFTIGTNGTFTVTATGMPQPTLSISGLTVFGLTFDPATGILSGTPAPGTSGTYPLTINASNGIGTQAQQTFTLTVNEPLSVINPAMTTFTVGAQGSFTFVASGFPKPTWSTTSTLPSGVTLNPSTGTLTGTPDIGTGGTYQLSIVASNSAGSSATQNFTLTVNEAPSFTSDSSSTFTVGTPGTFFVTTYGFPKPTLSLITTLPSGLTFNTTTGVLSGTPALGTGGVYNLFFQAANGIGSAQTQNFTLTINEAPSFTSPPNAGFAVGHAGATFKVTTFGFPTPTLNVTGTLPTEIMFNSSTGTFTAISAPTTIKTYALTLTATNNLRSIMQPFTLTVGQSTAITSPAAATFTVGTQSSFAVTVTGNPAVQTISMTGTLPNGVTFDPTTGLLKGTPAPGTGRIYPLTFTATNNVNTVTQQFTLTVNQAPAITSAPKFSIIKGTSGSFTITATGFPAPTFSVGTTLPFGVSLNPKTGVLTVSTSVTSFGTYTLPITASNNVGAAATQNLTLVIGQPPIITAASTATFAVGVQSSFTVTSTGYPAPVYSLNLDPSIGLTFNPSTGVLSGTPNKGKGGSYRMTITANNGVGSTSSKVLTLLVTEPLVITSPPSTTFVVGVAGRFVVTQSGFPVGSLTLTGVLPTGVTFNSKTGVLSGTPIAGTARDYILTIKSSNNLGTVATQTFKLTVAATSSSTAHVALISKAITNSVSFGTSLQKESDLF